MIAPDDLGLRALVHSPVFWVCATVGAYALGQWLQRRCNGAAAANPVLAAICVIIALLHVSGVDYATYMRSVAVITFLLGPATVALAVPLLLNIHAVGRNLSKIAIAVVAGGVTAIVSGSVVVWALGGTDSLVLSMAPKAATTPIALEVAREVGGLPGLTASLAVSGGVLAAVLGPPLLQCLKVRDPRARGLAAGVAGSAVATAEIARLGSSVAAFAVVGLGLNGLLTALLVPMLTAVWKWRVR